MYESGGLVSTPEIARTMGFGNHSTVVTLLGRLKKWPASDNCDTRVVLSAYQQVVTHGLNSMRMPVCPKHTVAGFIHHISGNDYFMQRLYDNMAWTY